MEPASLGDPLEDELMEYEYSPEEAEEVPPEGPPVGPCVPDLRLCSRQRAQKGLGVQGWSLL